MKRILSALCGLAFAGTLQAGNIFMTGHDVLLHNGQNGYDNVILDYLLDGGVAADYKIGLLRGNSGGVGSLGTATLEGFGGVTSRDIASFTDGADFDAFLAGVDVIVIPSHTSCGGCDLETSDADILEGFSSNIAAWFNAGGDIYANSGAGDETFYDFLPPAVAASGPPIGGSSGFECTAAGDAIGITGDGCAIGGSRMINGFPTHNRFTDFDSDFTIFETRGEEIISIGLRDGFIGDDDISTGGDGGDGGDGGGTVPVPGTLFLVGIALLGLGASRRRS